MIETLREKLIRHVAQHDRRAAEITDELRTLEPLARGASLTAALAARAVNTHVSDTNARTAVLEALSKGIAGSLDTELQKKRGELIRSTTLAAELRAILTEHDVDQSQPAAPPTLVDEAPPQEAQPWDVDRSAPES